MSYVDGYVLIVPTKKMKAYKKMAAEGAKTWMKHGALAYMECEGDDLESAAKWGGLPFTTLTNAKKGETVIFSYIVYKSKKDRDMVNKKVHAEFEVTYDQEKDKGMPFDMKRMAFGGFKTIVEG